MMSCLICAVSSVGMFTSRCLTVSVTSISPVIPSLQSLAELSTLQGLEDDHAFQKEVSLKTLVYKAYRLDCFVLPPHNKKIKLRSNTKVSSGYIFHFLSVFETVEVQCCCILQGLGKVVEVWKMFNFNCHFFKVRNMLELEYTSQKSP